MGAEPVSAYHEKEMSDGKLLLAEAGARYCVLPVPAWALGICCIPLPTLSVIMALQRL